MSEGCVWDSLLPLAVRRPPSAVRRPRTRLQMQIVIRIYNESSRKPANRLNFEDNPVKELWRRHLESTRNFSKVQLQVTECRARADDGKSERLRDDRK